MAEIPLTQGKVTLVDKEDYEFLSQWKWFARKNGINWYASRQSKKDDGSPKTINMHSIILNPPKGMEIDHINGDGLDNRRSNLRLCFKFQNQRNSKLRLCSSSGYKGVSFSKDRKKWRADIRIHGKLKNLGFFLSKEEAAIAYNKAAIKEFGEFAKLNEVIEIKGL